MWLDIPSGLLGLTAGAVSTYLWGWWTRKRTPRLSWMNADGRRTDVKSIGHGGVTVSYVFRRYGDDCRLTETWSFERCAKDADWPLQKMLDFLGVPDQATLREAGMTRGEWLEERSR